VAKINTNFNLKDEFCEKFLTGLTGGQVFLTANLSGARFLTRAHN